MVEINFDVRRPAALLDLNRVSELTTWQRGDGQVRLGAGVTYTRIITELGALLPGLAMAARTVGSPQIRNRGTVGGNLGAASPAGDCHPVLLAAGASRRGDVGPRLAADPGGRILHRPQAQRPGPGRADHRGADPGRRRAPSSSPRSAPGTRWSSPSARSRWSCAPRRASAAPGIGTGIGSAGPTPLRACAGGGVPGRRAGRGGTVGIGGVRCRTRSPGGSASWSRPRRGPSTTCADRRPTAVHALGVLARRTLTWAWQSYRGEGGKPGCG